MAIQPNRVPMILAFIGIALFIGTLIHQTNIAVPSSWRGHLSKVYSGTPKDTRPSFYEIALSHGTDKVTTHSYHHMYQKYLSPFRDVPFKMLEIGLGCDMNYGPGASYWTWLEYFPYVDLYYIEYDAACAEKWAGNTTGATIFAGDQADVKFLERFMKEAGEDFDVIIDDGGHHMNQQIVSLQTLWRAVVPGGLYFCEDLQTSYWENYEGDPTQSGKVKTMMGMIKELADDLNVRPAKTARKHAVSQEMQFVDCMEEVCAFGKKEIGSGK
ncbi:unnamed protein product [Zymoseptoria tritici ST99CH_1A5]|uniref:Methyltransferase domain-containing protein n=1 Tax=Zymoseptoria tritici ST99CH_1A5 TaxID=1276529 RepID=A0A1Y6LJ17_ZYMTR|nr:unnamed protein product [Zymoseptoria tritici ST99CH_1A5]